MVMALTLVCFEGTLCCNGGKLMPMGAVARALPVVIATTMLPTAMAVRALSMETALTVLPVATALMALLVAMVARARTLLFAMALIE